MAVSDRVKHSKQQNLQNRSEISSNAVKQGTQGVAKGVDETAETVSHFQYAPTLIALFPVFASFFFGSHTEHWTDLILLGLVAIYLHNCVAVPWGYYKASRRRYKTSNREMMTEKQIATESQLRMAELQAFGGLILGPLLGSALLNYVRNTMARPANGLITNFNITVFVLAAELRPLRIAYGYLTDRSNALQEELTEVVPARYEALERRIEDLTSRLQDGGQSRGSNSPETKSPVTNGHAMSDNPELSQLKYALKKFEKYEANTKYELESKLYSLERRIADLGTRSEPVRSTSHSMTRILTDFLLLPFRILWRALTLPLYLSERMYHTVAPESH